MNVNPPITNFQQLLTSHHIPSDGSLVGGPDGTPTDPARIDVLSSSVKGDTSMLFLVEGTTKPPDILVSVQGELSEDTMKLPSAARIWKAPLYS